MRFFHHFFVFMNNFNCSSFSNFSKHGLYSSPCSQIFSVYPNGLSLLDLIKWVWLLMPLTVGLPQTNLLLSGAYLWSYLRPNIPTFPFLQPCKRRVNAFRKMGAAKLTQPRVLRNRSWSLTCPFQARRK